MNIEQLIGKTLTSITGGFVGSDDIRFKTEDGEEFIMRHTQDCCESVYLEDITGDLNDLLSGDPILEASEEISGDNPPGATKEYQDSFTWTFYKLGTRKGPVTLRWYGESNGYYSEGVDFEKV